MWRRAVRLLPIRGPKKSKKADTKTVDTSTPDTVNIFVDKRDEPRRPIEEYPPWLRDISADRIEPSDLARKIARGDITAEMSAGDTRRIIRWNRKANIFYANFRKPYPGYQKLDVFGRRKNPFKICSGEDPEDDYEDHLEPYYRLALGVPWKKERDRMDRRMKGKLLPEDMQPVEEVPEAPATAAATPATPAETPGAKGAKGKKKKKDEDCGINPYYCACAPESRNPD